MTLRSQEVRRSEKKRKKIPENPDFPDPDFRISVHAVAIEGPRPTCSQNFRPLATILPELPPFEVDNYIKDTVVSFHLFVGADDAAAAAAAIAAMAAGW